MVGSHGRDPGVGMGADMWGYLACGADPVLLASLRSVLGKVPLLALNCLVFVMLITVLLLIPLSRVARRLAHEDGEALAATPGGAAESAGDAVGLSTPTVGLAPAPVPLVGPAGASAPVAG